MTEPSDESLRVEESFARWEEDRDIQCSNHGCDYPALYIVTVHGKGIFHGFSWRCQRCFDLIRQANTQLLKQTGAIRCGMCFQLFSDMDDLMKVEKM